MALPVGLGRLTLLVAVVLAPLVAIALTPPAELLGPAVLGAIATAGSIRRGAPAMWRMAVSSGIITVLGVAAAATGPWLPVTGTLLVVAASLATSALPKVGLASSGGMVVTSGALLLIKPVTIPVDAAGPWAAAVISGLIVGGATAWIAGLLSIVIRGRDLPRPELPMPTVPYSALLAVLAGGFTFISLIAFPDSNAWWSVLTVAIILQPTYDRLWSKLAARVLGTVVGGVIAAALALVLPSTATPAALGFLALAANVVLTVKGAPYWQSASAVTVAVVMLTFDSDALIAGDLQRVLITLLAAVVTALAVAAMSRFAGPGTRTPQG
ncbi:hypothetical protein GCM10022200_02570 [Microbacterium awajiense]|uniref:Integral membrane bound transporter domain-containing protein n=1 Tax=Microbacterium awajiense TaxID=415214 RepID=A0ABP7A2S9_9MICO